MNQQVLTRTTAQAAAHLVDYRDGLAGHLMWLAKDTADLSAPDQAVVISRLLLVLGKDEAHRGATQISVLATPCWGIFRELMPERLAAVELLHRVCRDTATAVRDELHRDACLCKDTAEVSR